VQSIAAKSTRANPSTYQLKRNIDMTESMEAAAQRLADPSNEFDVALLDNIIVTAYNPAHPQRAAANKALMALQESPELWSRADTILERAVNPQTRFFGLQVLDDAIRTR